jgi:RND family efflux transporter MFP subunit
MPLVVVFVAGLGAAGLVITAPELESAPLEEVVAVVRVMAGVPQDLALVVRSQGTVEPRTESDLVSEVSGRVTWVSPALASGGFFEAEEPLLRIDPGDYEMARARARASLARAQGEWEHARENLARRENLAERNIASSSQLDDARRTSRVAEASLEEARVALRQADRDLARTEIRAPYAGRVREKNVDVGQFIARGSPAATLYATDYVEVRLPVPDSELAFLDLPLFGGQALEGGPPVSLSARFAGREHTWLGRIVRTEGEIDPKSRMVRVVARVEDPYVVSEQRAPLAVGLFVQAEITGPVANDVLVVPRSALREDGRLLLVDAEDRIRLREAEVLRMDYEQAVVRAELKPGERVCVSPLQAAVAGMLVRPVEVPAGEARS